MSNMVPDLAVIVINYNTPTLTQELIRTVTQYSSKLSYEILVVDNNSQEGFKYVPPPVGPRQRVIHLSRNIGFARAANLGVAISPAPFLLFANSDCRLQEDVLSDMLEYLRRYPDCCACSPRLIFPDGSPHQSVRRFPDYHNIRSSRGSLFPSGRAEYTLEPGKVRQAVEAVSATFLMVRRDCFDRVGRFAEMYFMYVEDTDLCRRFAVAGRTVVYLGDLEVIHHWGGSTCLEPLRMKFEHHRSIRNYFLDHFPDRFFANLLLTVQLGVNLILVGINIVFLRRRV